MRVAFILYCPPSQYPNLARPRFVLQASKRSGHEILIVFLFWQQDVSNRTRLWYKTLCRTYRTPPANMEEESMWVCCRPPTPTKVKEQPSCRTRALCAVACASSRGHTKVYRLSTVLFVCPRPLLILVPFSKLKPENWHPVIIHSYWKAICSRPKLKFPQSLPEKLDHANNSRSSYSI